MARLLAECWGRLDLAGEEKGSLPSSFTSTSGDGRVRLLKGPVGGARSESVKVDNSIIVRRRIDCPGRDERAKRGEPARP